MTDWHWIARFLACCLPSETNVDDGGGYVFASVERLAAGDPSFDLKDWLARFTAEAAARGLTVGVVDRGLAVVCVGLPAGRVS